MSTQARQTQIDDLIAQALNLPAGDRKAFLVSACGDDAGVLSEFHKLLAAQERAKQPSEFLALNPDDEQPFRGAKLSDTLIGQHIGPYEVKRWLGGGGFG